MANFKVTKGGTLPKSSTKADVYALVDNAAVDIYNIDNADIVAAAGIPDSKLATIAMKNKVNLSALTIAGQTAGDILYSTDGVTFIRLPIGTAGQVLSAKDTRVPLDYFEYSTDALAQAAYAANGILSYSIDQCTGGAAISGGDSVGSKESAFDDSASTSWYSSQYGSSVSGNAYIGYDFGAGITKQIERFTIKQTVYPNALASVKLCYSDNGSSWTALETFSINADNSLQTIDVTETSSAHRYWRLLANQALSGSYVWGVYEVEFMTTPSCYSEGIIKQQGSYSLKVVANMTISLNKTLTRTVSPVINLTDLTSIQFRIRASRTGANIKIGIHDSGGTTSEKTYTVVAANTWETVTWDISAVSNANKDAIDSIIITIVNADADNTFYLDFMFAGISPYDSEIGWVTP